MHKQHHKSAGKSHPCTSAQATLPSDLHGKQSGIILVQRSHGGAFHPGGTSPAILSLVPTSPTPPPARQQMLFGGVVRCANNERGSSCGSLCIALSMMVARGEACVRRHLRGSKQRHSGASQRGRRSDKVLRLCQQIRFSFPSIFREEAEAISLKYTSKTQEEGKKKILNQMMHGLGRAWLHLCADRIGPLG